MGRFSDLGFPVWVLEQDGAWLSSPGPNGEVGLPVFPSKQAAKDYQAAFPEHKNFTIQTIPDHATMVQVIDGLEQDGYTHVVRYTTAADYTYIAFAVMRSL